MAFWTTVYHRLPPPLRSAAASWWGWRLRSIRYGDETEKLVIEALARDTWSAEQWRSWQRARLEALLERAVSLVPYYERQWHARAGGEAAMQPWGELREWPLLEKERLRAEPRSFIARDCLVRDMVHDHTSGTTGASVDLWFRRDTVRAWYALFEARCRRWYGITRHDRWAIVGGQLVTPVRQRRPPFWVWNAALRQLYLSAYHLAPDLTPRYLDAMGRHRVTSLFGYPSALEALARGALLAGRRDIELKVAVTNAEPLLAHQRAIIAEAFRCPVRETYGMAEIVTAASECESGTLHLWPDVGIVECFAGGEPVRPGEPGDLVCTGLLNLDMPLIRYRVGDRGAIAEDGVPCACGRTLPRLSTIEGRSDDVLITRDGRRIGRLDPVFKDPFAIREAQIIQETLDEVRVRFVPTDDYDVAAGEAIREALLERLGAVRVVLEAVREIPRGPNGKFRTVVCSLSDAERRVAGL